jgi:chromosome partitioning protein
MAAVIALANHKGGVTKTTSTANLGAMLAERGYTVLMIDCDPQANLSEAFGWNEELPGERLEDLLALTHQPQTYCPPLALQPDVGPDLPWRGNLRLIPCTDVLANVAADLPQTITEGYEQQLRRVVDWQRAAFAFILLDTPPGLSNLSGMALMAADYLLIPALPSDLDVRGAGKVYDLVGEELPDLQILGVLIAAGDRRWRLTREASLRMNEDHMRVLPVQVPRAVRVGSAPRYRAPTAVLEPDSLVTDAYRRVATHILSELPQ